MLLPARHALHVDGPAGPCGSGAHRPGARPLPDHATRRRRAKGTVHTHRTGVSAPACRARPRPRFLGQRQRLSSPGGCPAIFCDTDSSISDLEVTLVKGSITVGTKVAAFLITRQLAAGDEWPAGETAQPTAQ